MLIISFRSDELTFEVFIMCFSNLMQITASYVQLGQISWMLNSSWLSMLKLK